MRIISLNSIHDNELDDFVLAPAKYIRDIMVTPERFCRDVGDIPTTSIVPFFRLRHKIKEVIDPHLLNPFLEKEVGLREDWEVNDNFPRYIHIDLAKNQDRAGICCVHTPNFMEVVRRDKNTNNEVVLYAPHIVVDFLGVVSAPVGGEIRLVDFVHLVEEVEMRGAFVNLVTFDQYQSVQAIQMLRDVGFTAGVVSIDRTTHGIIVNSKAKFNIQKETTNGDYCAAMSCLREAMYEGRLKIPYHELWEAECEETEWIPERGIAEKSTGGTDDLLQPVAGAVFGLTLNEMEYQEPVVRTFTEEELKARRSEEQFRMIEREHHKEVNAVINTYRREKGDGKENGEFSQKFRDWENSY